MRFDLILIVLLASTTIPRDARCGPGPVPLVASPSDPLAAADRMVRTARSMLATDPAEAARIARTSQALAAREPAGAPGRALAIAAAQWLQGESALRLGQEQQARAFIDEALRTVLKEQPRSGLHGDLLVTRGRLESSHDQTRLALADYLAAFEIYGQVGDARRRATTLQDIGLIYENAGDFDRALYYYSSSRETFSGDAMLDLSLSNNRADALDDLKRFKEAQSEYQRALGSAEKLGSPLLQAQILNNLAIAQLSDGRFAAAQVSIVKGLRLSQSGVAAAWRPLLLGTAAQLALKTNKLPQAKALLDQAFASHVSDIDTQRYLTLHQTAYLVYKQQGADAEALAHLEIYQRLQNESRTLMASTNAALMDARFDFSNQNARIATLRAGQLQRDIAVTRLRARQNQILLGGLLLIVTGVIVFLVLYLRSLRRSRDSAHEANIRLQKVNTELGYALQAKSQFLATTSHEIRTPLNGVLGMTQVLLADAKLDAGVRRRVALIHGAGEAMRTLVNDLLDLSKMDAGPVEIERAEVDLPMLLREVHQFWVSQAGNGGLELTLSLDGSPSAIIEDARRLRQILANLLSNAIKFTPSGTVAMSVATALGADGEQLLIRVEDSGIGIPIEARERVFEKFEQLDASITRKYGGSGLGLAIARNLARAMGGDVTVAAGAQRGSVFTVTLPLRRVPTRTDGLELPRKGAASSLADSHVLMVEPNPIKQGGYRAILEREVSRLTSSWRRGEAARERLASGGVDIVIAGTSPGQSEQDDSAVHGALQLAAVARRAGARAVIIVDDDEGAEEAFGKCGASRLHRPVTGEKLVRHLRGLAHDQKEMVEAV